MTGEDGAPESRPDERPDERSGEPPDERSEERSEDERPVGIFPSWGWVYGTALAWFVVVVVALYVLTVALDHGAP